MTNTVVAWENKSAATRCGNTEWPLTHLTDATGRQDAMNPTQCSMDGCERGGQMRRGMCAAHYERLRRRRELDPLPVLSTAERLAVGCVRQPNGCLEWQGSTGGATSTTAGYGLISVNGKNVGTHRLAWMLVNGPIPNGMLIRHVVCDNPPCCEPTHLALGTDADNHADMMAKGRHPSQEVTS